MKRSQDFSPSGFTPTSKSRQVARGRQPSSAAKALFLPESKEGGAGSCGSGVLQLPSSLAWSNHEEARLVQYMSTRQSEGAFSVWPAFTDSLFWSAASEAVSDSDVHWSSEACKLKFRRKIKPMGSLSAAMLHFDIPKIGFKNQLVQTDKSASNLQSQSAQTDPSSSSQTRFTQTEKYSSCTQSQSAQTDKPVYRDVGVKTDAELPEFSLPVLQKQFVDLAGRKQVEVLQSLFSITCSARRIPTPSSYIENSLSAMSHLELKQKPNVLVGAAYVFGNMRPDGSDSRFPTDKMPFGLLEHCINYYSAQSINEVPRCPSDYALWQQTMYNIFGTKWLKLHCGPGWSVVQVGQERTLAEQGVRDPLQASVNIPGVSERTIRRRNQASDYSKGASIQVPTLSKAATEYPGGDWWIKADGCDLNAGVMESVEGKWHGDVDLNDGKLTELYEHYQATKKLCSSLGMKEPRSICNVKSDIQKMRDTVVKPDIAFLSKGLEDAEKAYRKKLEESTTQETLKKLAWNVDEFRNLYGHAQNIVQKLNLLVNAMESHSLPSHVLVNDVPDVNIPRMLSELRPTLLSFEKEVFRKKRTPAKDVLVVMISEGTRLRKPYALPVQCIPNDGLKDKQVRQICDAVKEEMVKAGLSPKGLVTDGEFNSLRSQGTTRPLSVLQIRSESRSKFRRLAFTTMEAMITITGVSSDGIILTVKESPAVTQEMLRDIESLQAAGKSMPEVIDHLRQKTVPSGYTPHTWSEGVTEDTADKLRSVLAQSYYSVTVKKWESQGVPFQQHWYVPEVDPVTKKEFHEREDHGHLLKRIAMTTREGRNEKILLDRFAEALEDQSSGLTYSALTGVRKQSVSDSERMFSSSLCQWFKRKGYHVEAKYVEVINNWHRAADERGLTEAQRSQYNQDMLMFMVDDLMPWHTEAYDLSLLEVNRPLDNIQGFTRETTLALLTTIESIEWERRERVQLGLPPEHPRSSTTDDVECFFSIIRDLVGSSFTLKKVQEEWKKICIEFDKRTDSSLPFYYFSSAHDRFYEGERPAFNNMPTKQRQPLRAPQRESQFANSLAVGRISLPTRGARSKRLQFHSGPTELPPPPALHCHQYC